MIKILQYNDLHLEHNYPGQYFHPGEGDIIILAGDILCARHLKTDGHLGDIYRKFIKECSENFTEVIYCQGNHEAYSFNYEGAFRTIKESVPDNFHVLENETFKFRDINFICCTLWTNFFNENPIQMMDAQMYMNDYKSIRITSNYRKLNTNDVLSFHKNSFAYIKEKVEELKNERVFVVTHHSPTLRAIAPKFKTSPTNGSFCSDLDNFILDNPNIKNWAFGHVHTPFDFMIGECRMTCNPRGYPHEDTGFNNDFFIEIE